MFADELRKAIQDKDRAAICRLIEAIPTSRWSCPGSPPHAQAWEDSVGIAVHHVSGGSGINTYDSVSVSILWPDGTTDFGGQYSAEELRMANYIPRPNAVPARVRADQGERTMSLDELKEKARAAAASSFVNGSEFYLRRPIRSSRAIRTSWPRVPHTRLLKQLLQSSFHGTFRDIEMCPNFLVAEPLERALQYLILPLREGSSWTRLLRPLCRLDQRLD